MTSDEVLLVRPDKKAFLGLPSAVLCVLGWDEYQPVQRAVSDGRGRGDSAPALAVSCLNPSLVRLMALLHHGDCL